MPRREEAGKPLLSVRQRASLPFFGLPYNLSSAINPKNLCPAPGRGKRSGCVPESLAWPGPRRPGGKRRGSPSQPLRGDPGPRRAGGSAPTQTRCGGWVQPKGFGIGWHRSEKSHNGFRGGVKETARKAATLSLKTIEEPDRRANRGLGRFAF